MFDYTLQRKFSFLFFFYLLIAGVSLGQTPIPGIASSVSNSLLQGASGVAVSGNYAYVINPNVNVLSIFDISRPEAIAFSGSLANGQGGAAIESAFNLCVAGNYAYVANQGGNSLEIVNVSNPNNPTHAAVIYHGTGGAVLQAPSAVAVRGNYAFISTRNSFGVEVIDISNPHAPQHVSFLYLNKNLVDIVISGNYAFAAGIFSLQVLDIQNPLAPVLVGGIENGGPVKLNSVTRLDVKGNYAYVLARSSDALEIVDISNPANPTHAGAYVGLDLDGYGSVSVSGNYAYVSSYGKLSIIDITNPAAPVLNTNFNLGISTVTRGVVAFGNFAFTGSYDMLNAVALFTPARPVPSTGVITSNSFLATWNPYTNASSYAIDVSADNFSSFISGYNNFTLANHSVSVTGLTPATNYQFRVRAANANGSSPSSAAVSVLTAPAAPVAVAATIPTQSGFTANWNAVTGATNYFIDVANDATFTSILPAYANLSIPAGTTSLVITGLGNGTTYYYRVRAANSSGSSPSSNTSSQITIPANPITAAGSISSIGQKGFTSTWIASAGASGYAVDVATDAIFSPAAIVPAYSNLAVVSGTSLTVTGLTEGTAYYFRVRATNAAGTSGNSSAIQAITLPATVMALSAASPSQSGFTARWEAATGIFTNYFIDVATDATFTFTSILSGYNNLSVPSGATSLAINGLGSGITYFYRVRAANSSGSSPSSNTSAQITIPANPAGNTGTSIAQKSFNASWAPTTGAAGYFVDVATDNTFTPAGLLPAYINVSVNVGTSLSVTGLSEGTTYFFRVRASNTAGTSGNSTTTPVLTLPATVTAIAASLPSPSGFTARWNAVTTSVSNYFVDVASDAAFTSILAGYNNLSVSSVTTSLAITGLSSGTTYFYRVRAANVSGSSPNSNTISQITVPGAPIASPGSNQTITAFTAAWQDVSGKDSFEVDVSVDNFLTFVKNFQAKAVAGSQLQLQVTGLAPGTTYQYRVRAKNSAGLSSNSNTISVLTQSLPPPAQFQILFPTGGRLEDFRIISIPLNTVASTNLTLDKFESSWRIQRFDNSKQVNEDVRDVSQLRPLRGYWVNSNIDGTPAITATGSFFKQDTAITLAPKWNQIGNPFTTNISWADVLALNPSVSKVSQLFNYNVPSAGQGWQNSDALLAFGGGFVNNANAGPVTLKIPATVKSPGGRFRTPIHAISNRVLSEKEWFLPVMLEAGGHRFALGGLGMHPAAAAGFDSFDVISLPRSFTVIDIRSTHADFFQPDFMQDVVPTSDHHSWTFTVSGKGGSDRAVLSWDNKSLGENAATLILYDPASGIFIDMKKTDTYSFRPEAEHTLKFFFSSDGKIMPDVAGVGTPYPNPSSAHVTIPFITHEPLTQVQIVLYDGLGKPVRRLMNEAVEAGMHEAVWDATDDQGVKAARGIYFYRFSTPHAAMQSGKILIH